MSWCKLNAHRGVLIKKKLAGTITPAERDDLAALQRVTTILARLTDPLPLKELEYMRDMLVGEPQRAPSDERSRRGLDPACGLLDREVGGGEAGS